MWKALSFHPPIVSCNTDIKFAGHVKRYYPCSQETHKLVEGSYENQMLELAECAS